MRLVARNCFLFLILLVSIAVQAQDSVSVYKWKVTSRKTGDKQYELVFSAAGAKGWQLYAPNQVLSDVPTTEYHFNDSAINAKGTTIDSGSVTTLQSPIFNVPVKVYEGPTTWKQQITITGTVPEKLQGTLTYTYGHNVHNVTLLHPHQ